MNTEITESDSNSISYPKKGDLPTDESGALVPPEGIRVLSNGAGFCETRKRMVYGPGTFGEDPNAFDTERAHEAHLAKIRKAENEVIQAIEAKTGIPFDKAFGQAAAVLWDQIVLGHTSDKLGGRERVDAWERIGRRAGVVPDKEKAAVEGRLGSHGDTAVIPVELAREVRKILELRKNNQEPPRDVEPPDLDLDFSG